MKKCSNGHFYNEKEHAYCPYCPKPEGANKAPADDDTKTIQQNNGDLNKTKAFDEDEKTKLIPNQNPDKTKVFDNPEADPAKKTSIFDEEVKQKKKDPQPDWNKTFIGIEPDDDDDNDNAVKNEAPRATRRLVGWLVSYTIDPMGRDFRLYEGKNTIGSKPQNEITVPGDKLVSSVHATVLFRKNKFKLKDEFSTNGTFVNNEDLDDEVYTLQDGDMIRVGDTVFKFRSAL